jgi:hypothetical protein
MRMVSINIKTSRHGIPILSNQLLLVRRVGVYGSNNGHKVLAKERSPNMKYWKNLKKEI